MFQVAAFADPEEFGRQVGDWICTLRATRSAAGTSGPMIPSDPNRRGEEVRRREQVRRGRGDVSGIRSPPDCPTAGISAALLGKCGLGADPIPRQGALAGVLILSPLQLRPACSWLHGVPRC